MSILTFWKQQASSIFYTLLSRLEEEFPTASRFSRLRAEFLHEIGHVLYLEDFSDLLLSTIDEIRLQLTTLSLWMKMTYWSRSSASFKTII